MRRTTTIGFAVIVAVACAVSASGQSFRDEALEGLDNLKVSVEDLRDIDEEAGLTTLYLKRQVLLRLRRNGISARETNPSMARATLYVDVKSVEAGNLLMANLDLELHTTVTVESTLKTAFKATIWNNGNLIGSSFSGHRNHVTEVLLEMVDEFSNDYLSVNPKKP